MDSIDREARAEEEDRRQRPPVAHVEGQSAVGRRGEARSPAARVRLPRMGVAPPKPLEAACHAPVAFGSTMSAWDQSGWATRHEAPSTFDSSQPRRTRAQQKDPVPAPITILIPCFNERGTIVAVLDRVRRLPVEKTIVVVDNCSTDGTREALLEALRGSEHAAPPPWLNAGVLQDDQRLLVRDNVACVLQPRNRKKGSSVLLGLALAKTEYFVCQDADLEYDPHDILRLLAHARRHHATAVFGTRVGQSPRSPRVRGRWNAYALARVALTWLFRALYGTRTTDVATCYKLLRTETARSLGLQTTGFELDFEIPAQLALRGHRIDEVPIAYSPRSREQGKKIGWGDGFWAVWTLLRLRVGRTPQRLPNVPPVEARSG